MIANDMSLILATLTGGQRPTQYLATFANQLLFLGRSRLGYENCNHRKMSRTYRFCGRMRLQGIKCSKCVKT